MSKIATLLKGIAKTSDSGYATFSSISAGSYADVSITFSTHFINIPRVVATRASVGSAGYDMQLGIKDISPTGCTIRCWNNGTAAITPSINWIAVRVGGVVNKLLNLLAPERGCAA